MKIYNKRIIFLQKIVNKDYNYGCPIFPFCRCIPEVQLTSDINSSPVQKYIPHSNSPTTRRPAMVKNRTLPK
jgi:hypothetical protein